MTYAKPIIPGLRDKLASEPIRDQLGLIATEFALFPNRISSGDTKGMEGGQWNNGLLQNPTVNLGIIGNTTQPCVVVSGYIIFDPAAYTTLGTGNIGLVRNADGRLKLYDGSKVKLFTDDSHNLVMGDAVTELAANAGGGFLYISTVPTAATGTPTTYTGAVPIVFDRALNTIGIYDSGAWLWTVPAHSVELSGSATYDPASLTDSAGATTTVTVTGAALGNYVSVSFSLDLQGIILTGYVSAANTVAVRFQNETGGTIDLASGTIMVAVRNA